MVLEDVNESAPDSFSDAPYPDQNDQYAPSSIATGARFNPSDLPQPIPLIGPLMGFSDRAVRFKTETTLQFAERKLGRKLDAIESQALASHIYQLEQTKSYFTATGGVLGLMRAHATMATNRYPFYQPKPESINAEKFAFVKGPWAPVARHAWRFSLYFFIAGQMGNAIGQLIAQPLAAQRTSQDPKLERFGNELKASAVADQDRMKAHAQEIRERRREIERQAKDRNGMGPSPQASWGRQPTTAKGQDDDMSPTAGNEAWGSQPSSAGSWDTYSTQGEQASAQRSPRNQAPAFDDASPTGGLFQDEVGMSNTASAQPAQSQEQARPGESTWDRLRRGGAPIPAQRPPPPQSRQRTEPERKEQRDGSTLGDSFTFVEGEDERKKERERAQAEFDARIERERQGKDFSSDEGKRW